MGLIEISPLWIIAALIDIVFKLTALIIIPKGRKPTAAMAWLLAVFFLPYVGIFLFLIIGSFRLPATRRMASVGSAPPSAWRRSPSWR